MQFWIDVESATGTKYGAGPITSATIWQHTPRLDGAGEFNFTVPSSDPKSVYLANKRVVRCRGVLDGAVTELGMGIIDNITLDPSSGMLQVSGPDIVAELINPTVHDLVICEQAWCSLSVATDGYYTQIGVSTTGVPTDSQGEVAACHDGNLATAGAAQLASEKDGFPEYAVWSYVGYDARFDRIKFTLLDGGRIADAGKTLICQYYNGSGWETLSVTDGTNNGGTWRKSGEITFTRPGDWTRYDEAYGLGGDWFWVRMRLARTAPDDPSWTNYVDWAEVDVYADVPTTNGVNLIMAFAPDTWVQSGYPDTVSEKYLEFNGESVLEALVILTEQGGTDGTDAVREHFRYDPTAPREIDWLGTTVTPSGVRAVAPVNAIAAEGADELVVIQNLQRVLDSAEVVTRVYPRSLDGITTALATVDAPTGYTHGYVTVDGRDYYYIQHTAGHSAYGLIERHIEFSELSLQQADSYTTHPVDLANQVHERAVEFLRTHAVLCEFYQLSVMQFPALILPGDSIECVYHGYTDGIHAVNIDTIAAGTPLHILAPTLQIDSRGVSVIGLEVATIDREPKSDAGVVVDLVRQQKRGGVAASNLVTISSTVLPPPPGKLGGWSIDNLAIENNDAMLHSDGWIQLGSGNNIIRMDAQDAAYRMWAGAPLGADAPFSITVDGSLHAENAYIEGEIVAAEGAIGGFEIGADYIRDVANSMGLASTVTGGDDVRFWAGDTFANRATAPFRVTEAGLLSAEGATIEGALTATTGELVDLDVSGTLTLVSAGIIESDNFVAGLAGWQIDYNGDAEFNNVHVRGRIDTLVFEYDQISAVAGSILISPEAGVLAAAYTTDGTMTIEGAGFAFTDGSVVRIRAKDSLGAVQEVWVTVTRTGSDNVYTTAKESGDDKTWPVGTAVLGYGTGGGSLMMTAASALDGPRYSVNTHTTEPWTDEVEVARLGFLDNWQTYAETDYGIAIGDYAGGNYLLYGTTTGFEMRAGSGDLRITSTSPYIEIYNGETQKGFIGIVEVATAVGIPYEALAFASPVTGMSEAQGALIIGTDPYLVAWDTGGSYGVFVTPDKVAMHPQEGLTNDYQSFSSTLTQFQTDVTIGYSSGAPNDILLYGDYKNYRNATTYTGYIFVPAYVGILSNAAYDVDNDQVTLDLSDAGLPAGIKAVSLQITGICATAGKYIRFGADSTDPIAVELREPTANGWISVGGICPCDANGDIYLTTDAVDGAEFTVYMKATGYWI